MKFALAAILAFASSAIAAPLYQRAIEVDDDLALIARDFDYEDSLEARWDDSEYLEARSGPFGEITKDMKLKGVDFIEDARKAGKIHIAAIPDKSAKTVLTKSPFHLDRQQPPNARGEYKVAVQLTGNHGKKPTTVAQVKILPHERGQQPSDETVAAQLKHSMNTGKELTVHPPKRHTGKPLKGENTGGRRNKDREHKQTRARERDNKHS